MLQRSCRLFRKYIYINGAAAFAGFQQAAPGLDPESIIVVLATGNGLKDTTSAALGIQVPETLIETVEEIL